MLDAVQAAPPVAPPAPRGSRAAGVFLVAAVLLELASIGVSVASAAAVLVEDPDAHWLTWVVAPATLLDERIGDTGLWWGTLPFAAAALAALSLAATAFVLGGPRTRAIAVPACVLGLLLTLFHGITTLACVTWDATGPHTFMI